MLPKLVRDNIPEIIKNSGKQASLRTVKDKELEIFLIRKMVEEVSEFEDTPTLEEAADIYEVFLAFLDNWNLEFSEVKEAARIKRNKRGSFQKGLILEEVYTVEK